MTLIPGVKWAQRKGCVYTTIDLQDAKGEGGETTEEGGRRDARLSICTPAAALLQPRAALHPALKR